jgi:hypothetical protein
MEVSEQQNPNGAELIETVVSLTGLPEADQTQMHDELDRILASAGCAKENLTLEELRTALLGYLETLQEEIDDDGAPEAGR